MAFPRRYRILFPFLTAFILTSLPCAAGEAEGFLFVFTSPMGTSFSIDGTPFAAPAPALVRLPPGEHQLAFDRPGYRKRIETVTVSDSVPGFTDVVLSPEGVEADLGTGNPSGMPTLLSDGSFAVFGKGAETRLEPLFPGEGMLSVVNVLLPLSVGLALASTGFQIAAPRYGYLPFPAVPVLTGVLSLSVAGWKLSLELSKRAWLENFTLAVSGAGGTAREAEFRFREGEKALGRGDLDAALSFFSEVLDTHPESPYVPSALYNCARIHLVRGDGTLARIEFSALIERYPHPSLYDRSCKNLADIQYRNGAPEEALVTLGKMVFADPIHSRESIDAYAAGILETIEGKRAASSADGNAGDGPRDREEGGVE